MSYCRFSSDNWRSDVYCYEDCYGGWTIHIAGNRVVGEVPKMPEVGSRDKDAYLAAYRAQITFLETARHEDITLPHAGETMRMETAKGCAAYLLELRGLGYYVPQSAVDALLEEAEGESGPPSGIGET